MGTWEKRKEVERKWRSLQELPHVKSKSFELAIEASGRIGEVNRSEELWLEMKTKQGLKSTEQFNSMISVNCKHGFVSKAKELCKEKEKIGCKPNAITYQHLALGSLKAGIVKEALKNLELGMHHTTITKIRQSTPWLETTHSMVEIFAKKGDMEMQRSCLKNYRKQIIPDILLFITPRVPDQGIC